MESRKLVFSKLQDKEAVNILFNEVAQQIADRPGGYTRILKLGNRLGDNADMCLIELVDYNELTAEDKPKSAGGRRRRRRGSNATDDAPNIEATVADTTQNADEPTTAPQNATDEKEDNKQ